MPEWVLYPRKIELPKIYMKYLQIQGGDFAPMPILFGKGDRYEI